MFISLITIALLIAAAAFFSASETALTSISRARIYHMVLEGRRNAKLVLHLREQKERLFGAILIGSNTVNTLASALATSFAIAHYGEAGVIYATVAMTLISLIFGEVVPKTIALERAEKVSLVVAPIVSLIIKLITPINMALAWVIKGIFRVFGFRHNEDHSGISAYDMVRGSIEMHHQQGTMVKHDRDMLSSILDLDDVPLEDIMTHRTQVEMVEVTEDADAMVAAVIATPHSRIPLWQDTPDNIIGVLLVKHLLKALKLRGNALSVEDILALTFRPWFIPSTTSLKEQLMAFRQRRQHLAFVVDEYGSWLGIVTLEDILEEIVGEIDDEHDHVATPEIVTLQDGFWQVEGGVTIRELNRHLDWSLPDEHASTIAGLVIHEARRLLEEGESLDAHGLRFTVATRKGNQITRLVLERLQADQEADDAQ